VKNKFFSAGNCAVFRGWITALVLATCILLSGCTSFADVRDLQRIQDTPGYFPKAMYYCGSDEVCHYFEHETPLADMTILSKHVDTYMVVRKDLRLPEGAEYPHSSYTGRDDERRRQMHIRVTPHSSTRGAAEYSRSDYRVY
jgi:hypothetical protein